MEVVIQRLAALEADLRNKQVINKQLLENAHTDVMRNYLSGKAQVLDEIHCEVRNIYQCAKRDA